MGHLWLSREDFIQTSSDVGVAPNIAFYIAMAPLIRLFQSITAYMLAGFLLSIAALGALLGALVVLDRSPLGFLASPYYFQLSQFLKAFGGGDRWEGMVVIALTVGLVAALLGCLGAYKRRQRSQWHLAVSNAFKD